MQSKHTLGNTAVWLPVQAVENMRQGMRPRAAAEGALRRIVAKYPAYIGALVVLSARGEHAGAAHG